MKTAAPKTSTTAQNLQTKAANQAPFFQPEKSDNVMEAQQKPFFAPQTTPTPFFTKPSIQTKLSIGQPGDKYEQEADQMADQVVQRLTEHDSQSVKPLGLPEQQGKPIQRKPIFESQRKPLLQAKFHTSTPANKVIQTKCAECEKEEQLQRKEEGVEEDLQRKPIFESDAEAPELPLQTKLEAPFLQKKCAACTAEEETTGIQRAADSMDTPSASPSLESRLSRSRGGGSPLPESTRSQMEGAFGTDFSGVRVHTDSSAVQMNQELSAQAFTHGSDVYFNAGKYDTGSREGQRLLGHELTHVVQQGANFKQILQKDCDPTVSSCPPETVSSINNYQATSSISPIDPSFLEIDPCEIAVPNLTNQELILQIDRTRNYLDNHSRGQEDYFAFANLMRRLAEERQSRMRIGHIWLADDTTTPNMILELSTGSLGEIQINLADIQALMGRPIAPPNSFTSFITPYQFNHFLEVNNIPNIDAETYFLQGIEEMQSRESLSFLPPLPELPPQYQQFINELSDENGNTSILNPNSDSGFNPSSMGVIGGGSYNSPFSLLVRDTMSSRVFSNNVNMNNIQSVTGARSQWRGNLPETQFGSFGYGLFNQNLNQISRNFPIFDFRTRFSNHFISVKSVVPTNPNAPVNLGTYINGFDDMLGIRRPATFSQASTLLNANLVTPVDTTRILLNSYLAVNNDHISAARDEFENRIRNNPNDYIPLFDAYLSQSPITINNVTYRNWSDISSALNAGNLQDSHLSEIIDTFARRTRLKIIGHGMTTEEMRNILAFRERYQNIPEGDFRRINSPELIEAERYGGGTRGTAMAMRNAAIRGGIQGGIVSAVLETGSLLFGDESQNSNFGTRLAINTGTGALGGGLGSAIETQIIANASRTAMNQYLTGSISRFSNQVFVRGYAGGIAGGITAPITTMASMGLEELFTATDYIYIDYLAKGSRAIPSGAIAGTGGALAAGGVGLIAGSEVPILGNAVGFLVGIGLYYLSDSIIGDSIEEEVRLALGEGGCPRPVRTNAYTDDSHESLTPFTCFPADTNVLMSDTSLKRISFIKQGDFVLSYNEEKKNIQSCMVEKIIVHPPQDYTVISLENGIKLKATSNHPVFVDSKWKEVKDVEIGATFMYYDTHTSQLKNYKVIEINHKTAELPVYDLTINKIHNFFAEGILVHNKI